MAEKKEKPCGCGCSGNPKKDTSKSEVKKPGK
jgi:hypothetical protein